MDFSTNLSLPLAYGVPGTDNISNVNIVSTINEKRLFKWTTENVFIGIPSSMYGDIIDGINDKGLYCGYLYLPSATNYPGFDENNPKPAMSAMNLSAYFLGNCDNVSEVLNSIEQFQIVGSALLTVKDSTRSAVLFPLHLIVADAQGNSVLFEFVNGEVKIYTSQKGGDDVNTLTNSPVYDWQINNYNTISSQFVTENTDAQWDNLYMNGSGFIGLPGDWTPPDRFARVKTILANSPQPKNLAQAFYIAERAINSAEVPLGFNPAPTNWTSISDLKNCIYYHKQLNQIVEVKNEPIQATVPDVEAPATYKAFNVNSYSPSLTDLKSKIVRFDPSIFPVDYQKLNEGMLNGGSVPGANYKVEFLEQ